MGLPRSTYYDAPPVKTDDAEIVANITAICDELKPMAIAGSALHHTLQTTQQSVSIETRRPIVGGCKPISARRSECRSRKTLMPSFHRR